MGRGSGGSGAFRRRVAAQRAIFGGSIGETRANLLTALRDRDEAEREIFRLREDLGRSQTQVADLQRRALLQPQNREALYGEIAQQLQETDRIERAITAQQRAIVTANRRINAPRPAVRFTRRG